MSETRCAAIVWKRDTYRVNRRAPSGFSMHYNRCQCSRKAGASGLCAQHEKIAGGRHLALTGSA